MRSNLKSYRLVVGFTADYVVSSWEYSVPYETMKARCEHLHARLPEAVVLLYSRLGRLLLAYDGRKHAAAKAVCGRLSL